MAQRSTVPKFGNWESEENVPYTVYFDNARKGKSGRQITNPNDPQDNPYIQSHDTHPVQAPPFRTGVQSKTAVGDVRPKHVHHSSKEDFDLNQSTGSPWHHNPADQKATTNSPHLQRSDHELSSGDVPKRTGRSGTDRNFEQSPLHPYYNTKAGGRGSGVSSPISERNGLTPNTPGRSRMMPVADETPVPKFGEWDETDPASADGFTHIFNKVRQEKQGGSARVPIMNKSDSNGQKQVNNEDSATCGCFSWRRK